MHAKSLGVCPALSDSMDCQALLSIGFSRQECWSGFQALFQRIFQTQGLNLCFLLLPALAGGFFTTSVTFIWLDDWLMD